MRAEPWMNKTPIPKRSPLEIAEADVRHWSSRRRSAMAELEMVTGELIEACDRLDRLKR